MEKVRPWDAAAVLRLAVLLLIALIIIGPFLMLIFTSFKNISEVFSGTLALPKVIRLEAYKTVLGDTRLARSFLNSVIVTVGANLLITVLAVNSAYAVSRFTGWFGTALFGFFTLGMMIPTQVNMVPLYLMMSKLGLLNSHAGIIAVYVGFAMSFSVFVLSSFMRTLPQSMLEAAVLDGAGEGKTLLYVVAPLSGPPIATVITFNFVYVWNDLLFPLLFLTREKMRTIPIALLQYTGEYMSNYPVLFAGVLLAAVPMLLIFIFLQRYFVEGLTAGAIKG